MRELPMQHDFNKFPRLLTESARVLWYLLSSLCKKYLMNRLFSHVDIDYNLSKGYHHNIIVIYIIFNHKN